MKFDTTLTLLENILTDINVDCYYWYAIHKMFFCNIIEYLQITYEQNQ